MKMIHGIWQKTISFSFSLVSNYNLNITHRKIFVVPKLNQDRRIWLNKSEGHCMRASGK